jgi:hypothetical protein
LQLFKDGIPDRYIDGHDHRLSNWLHAVVGVTGSSVITDNGENDSLVAGAAGRSSGSSSSSPPPGVVRSNLWARQIGGDIYFYGLETIPANVELVVRSSASYARQVHLAAMMLTTTAAAEANSFYGELIIGTRSRSVGRGEQSSILHQSRARNKRLFSLW